MLNAFSDRYTKWHHKDGYNYSTGKAVEIYFAYAVHFNTLPMCTHTQTLVAQAIAEPKREMNAIASKLSEYDTVINMHSVIEVVVPQLSAEIDDVSCVPNPAPAVPFFVMSIVARYSRLVLFEHLRLKFVHRCLYIVTIVE